MIKAGTGIATTTTVTPPVATGAPETIVANGVVQNAAKTYRVTIKNFMATGGDGFTVLLGGTHVLGGAQDIVRGSFDGKRTMTDVAIWPATVLA